MRPHLFFRASALAAFALVIAPTLARADFNSAVADYAAQRFEPARAEFESLAALGDGASQFNLGAMYLRGEGVAKDRATGVGLMLAAAQNGFAGLGPEKLAALQAGFTAPEQATVKAVLDRYGRDALELKGVPAELPVLSTPGGCGNFQHAEYETIANRNAAFAEYEQDGLIVLDLTVGIDGLAHDPEVLLAFPPNFFDKDIINSYLQSRFKPAIRDGQPTPARVRVHMTTAVEGGGRLWAPSRFAQIRERAEKGQPDAQYFIGMAGSLDPTLGIASEHAHEMVLGAAKGGYPRAQYLVGVFEAPGPGCTSHARSDLWFEEAARRGEAAASIALARDLLNAKPGPPDLARVRALIQTSSGSSEAYVLRHAIALEVDPRLDPADASRLGALAERLQKAMNRIDPEDYDALAAAAAVNGDYPAAVSAGEHALSLAKGLYWNTSAIEERLAGYRAHRAFHGDLLDLPPRSTPPPPVTGRTLTSCTGSQCGRQKADEKQKKLGSGIAR